MNQVRIVSDGTGRGTKVFDAAGQEVTLPIVSIEWRVDADRSVVTLEIMNPEMDVIGEVKHG